MNDFEREFRDELQKIAKTCEAWKRYKKKGKIPMAVKETVEDVKND
jgi:hypothetical protein